jgi:two-component system, NarL family, invasion response regulator UvrY
MVRILIVDDHAIVRKGLKGILLEAYPSAHIEDVADADSMISKAKEANWDIIISDLSLPGLSGLEALKHLKQFVPKIPVLILSVHPEEQYAIRILKAGAAGYLNKDTAPDELVKAVQRVLQGRKYISSSVAEKLASSPDLENGKMSHELLSDREFEVLKLIASGKTISEIAVLLSLSITTVSTYRSRLLAKMDLKNNAELTMYAIENKLL